MANFRISPSGPVGTGNLVLPSGTHPSQNAPVGTAFFGATTAGPDTLIVDQGAFLISNTALNGIGADIVGPGTWTVTVNGFIDGTLVGLNLTPGNTSVSTITIGLEGSISSAGHAIEANQPAIIKNAGTIFGDVGIAISVVTALNTITNTGTITGVTSAIADLTGDLSKNSVTNFGTINGNVVLAAGDDTLTNSGKINGDVDLGETTHNKIHRISARRRQFTLGAGERHRRQPATTRSSTRASSERRCCWVTATTPSPIPALSPSMSCWARATTSSPTPKPSAWAFSSATAPTASPTRAPSAAWRADRTSTPSSIPGRLTAASICLTATTSSPTS